MLRRRRPTVVWLFGVANLLVGALGLVFYAGFGLLGWSRTAAPAGASLWHDVAHEVPLFPPVAAGVGVMSLVLCVLLLIAGTGLLAMHRWGRLLSLMCGALGVLLSGWNVFFYLAFVGPAVRHGLDATAKISAHVDRTFEATLVQYGVLGSAFAIGVYGVGLAAAMLSPGVAAAFRYGPGPDWED